MQTVETNFFIEEVEPTTQCKHKKSSCDKCGTSNRRDYIRTTKGGNGLISKLKKNKGK